jgi:hypothetical protein
MRQGSEVNWLRGRGYIVINAKNFILYAWLGTMCAARTLITPTHLFNVKPTAVKHELTGDANREMYVIIWKKQSEALSLNVK